MPTATETEEKPLHTCIYGTTNAGKLSYMREVCEPLGIRILSPNDLGIAAPDTQENGDNPLANARAKALAYHKAVSRHTPLRYSVFSCDSGLYIDGLTKENQPGVHVRRVRGTSLTDGEMIDYYSSLARSLGGKARARYRNAICLITPTGEIHESMEDDIASEEFWLVSEPHPNQESGFPLDSLSVESKSGEYYKDLKVKPRSPSQESFQDFFRMVFGLGAVKPTSATPI